MRDIVLSYDQIMIMNKPELVAMVAHDLPPGFTLWHCKGVNTHLVPASRAFVKHLLGILLLKIFKVLRTKAKQSSNIAYWYGLPIFDSN